MRTRRLKVRGETYEWLNAAACEVNQVFNYCNEISLNTATRSDTKRKWLTGCRSRKRAKYQRHLFYLRCLKRSARG